MIGARSIVCEGVESRLSVVMTSRLAPRSMLDAAGKDTFSATPERTRLSKLRP